MNDLQIKKFFLIFGKKIKNEEVEILKGKKVGKFLQNKDSKDLENKVFKYIFLLKNLPFIKEIFICNNISFGCANSKSDIDFFIVCKNNRLWIARYFGSFIIFLFGIKRTLKKTEKRFCLSFWASENGAKNLESLEVSTKKDFYLAIWTACLKPVLKNSYFKEFQKENLWIKNYGLNFVENKFGISKKSFLKSFLEFFLNFDFLESFLKKLFKKKMILKKEKIKENFGIIISDDFLKFHNKDLRKNILEKFKLELG